MLSALAACSTHRLCFACCTCTPSWTNTTLQRFVLDVMIHRNEDTFKNTTTGSTRRYRAVRV
ncbi:hypothetical protein C8Q78DRAFT_1014219 [Trametes maxima]|nr:hypothetical protein C8Q78DRAFT_1014219 [Trametes maxima]